MVVLSLVTLDETIDGSSVSEFDFSGCHEDDQLEESDYYSTLFIPHNGTSQRSSENTNPVFTKETGGYEDGDGGDERGDHPIVTLERLNSPCTSAEAEEELVRHGYNSDGVDDRSTDINGKVALSTSPEGDFVRFYGETAVRLFNRLQREMQAVMTGGCVRIGTDLFSTKFTYRHCMPSIMSTIITVYIRHPACNTATSVSMTPGH